MSDEYYVVGEQRVCVCVSLLLNSLMVLRQEVQASCFQ